MSLGCSLDEHAQGLVAECNRRPEAGHEDHDQRRQEFLRGAGMSLGRSLEEQAHVLVTRTTARGLAVKITTGFSKAG